jgi:hypothetical protein
MAKSWKARLANRQAAASGVVPAVMPVVSEKPAALMVPPVAERFSLARARTVLQQVMPQGGASDLPALKEGDIILRPARFLGGDCASMEMMDVAFARGDRGSKILKARQRFENLPEGQFVATDTESRIRGLVCFVVGEIPPDWTHLVVESIARQGNVAHVRACRHHDGKKWLFSKFTEEKPGPVVSFKEVASGTLSAEGWP